jgi:hypothetical protein
MNTHTHISGTCKEKFVEAKVLLLSLEDVLDQLVDHLPEGGLRSLTFHVKHKVREAIEGPRPHTDDELRVFLSSLNLSMITAGVLISYGDLDWRVRVEAKIAVFHPLFRETSSLLGHILCGMHLSDKGREEHFDRVMSAERQVQNA